MSVYDNNYSGQGPDDNESSIRLLVKVMAAYLMFYVAPALTNLTWPFAEHLLTEAYGDEVRDVAFWVHMIVVFVTSYAVLKLFFRAAIAFIGMATTKYGWDAMQSGLITLPF